MSSLLRIASFLEFRNHLFRLAKLLKVSQYIRDILFCCSGPSPLRVRAYWACSCENFEQGGKLCVLESV